MGVETARAVRDPDYHWREPSLEPVVWGGRGAMILGIHGEVVDRQVAMNLHDGYTTRDGERDIRLPRYVREGRRGSFDVTVNLSKCASLLEATGDSRIGDVLSASTEAVQRWLEKNAWTRNPWEQGGGLIMHAHRHGGSREGDPHLHDHIIIENLAPSSKGWKAVEFGKNVDWAEAGRIAADAQVKGFRQLGYRVKRDGNEYSIVGVPAEVKARFSKRHEAIQERAAEYEKLKGAPLSSKARSRLSVQGRLEKSDVTHQEQQASFKNQMSDEERAELNKVHLRSMDAVRRESWAHEARAAFERQRGYEVEREPERAHERSR